MPSFASSFGLGAITAWLSGSSKTEQDTARRSAKSKKRTKPSRLHTLTISSDIVEGKTFEEAMAALMDALPTSPTDAEEVDVLADELEATSLSGHVSTSTETASHDHNQHQNAEEPPAIKAALATSKNPEPGCQCCDWAFIAECTFRKVMHEAQSLGPGSTEYYDAVAHVYHHSPSQMARGKFLKDLIKNLKEQNWIGLDFAKKGGIKAMDYAAGTGLLGHALAPHVTEILAVDKSRKMVEQYNDIFAKENKTKCNMKAVQGDMTTRFLSGERLGIENPDGVCAGFDMVAMCLGVDFFSHESVPKDMKHKELMHSLDVIINLIDEHGTLLIIDIEKADKDSSKIAAERSANSPDEGLKVTGHGSKDIVKALEELGMEDVAVIGDQHFLFEAKHGSGPDAPTIRRTEMYFVLRAKRGALFEKRFCQRMKGFYHADGPTEAGGGDWA